MCDSDITMTKCDILDTQIWIDNGNECWQEQTEERIVKM